MDPTRHWGGVLRVTKEERRRSRAHSWAFRGYLGLRLGNKNPLKATVPGFTQ